MRFWPIPKSLLNQTARVMVCRETDEYRNPVWGEHTVEGVHLQAGVSYNRRGRAVEKTDSDTRLSMGATLFVDERLSKPRLPWREMLDSAHAAGGDMVVCVGGREYRVTACLPVVDGRGKLHHWEIEMR